MFIISLKDGTQLKEGEIYKGKPLTWDDVPNEVGIANLSLAMPFKIGIKKGEEIIKDYSPLVHLGKYDRYFFGAEAVAMVMKIGNGITGPGQGKVVAKRISGIDDKNKIVVEIRLDSYGNVKVNRYSLESLEKRIASGQMRETIIKK